MRLLDVVIRLCSAAALLAGCFIGCSSSGPASVPGAGLDAGSSQQDAGPERQDAAGNSPGPGDAVPVDAFSRREDVAPGGGPDSSPGPDTAGGKDSSDPQGTCVAGNTCHHDTRCQQTCFDGRVNSCVCSGGHYFCTGCQAPDGGTGDARNFPVCTGNNSVDGRICQVSGAVCTYQQVSCSPRYCVCAEVSHREHFWVCQ